MGNFRRNQGGFGRGNRSGGSSTGERSSGFGNRGGFGGSGGFRDRDNRRERRPVEMHEATCGKCGKRCEVPFRPTGDKPVFCRDCFSQEGSNGFSRGRNDNRSTPSAGSDQLAKINAKLDKILEILENVEIEVEEDGEDEDSDDEDEDSEDEDEKVKKSA